MTQVQRDQPSVAPGITLRAVAALIALALALTACGGGNTPTAETSGVAAAQTRAAEAPATDPVAALAQGARLNAAELSAAEKTAQAADDTVTGQAAAHSTLIYRDVEALNASPVPKSAYQSGAVARKAAAQRVTAYRFFNSQTAAHFFTTSEAERDKVKNTQSPPFSYEGPAFSVASEPSTGLSPVYRFYNAQTGVHFYTISEAERANVRATLPQLQEEGVAYYASKVDGQGFVPFYRFYRPGKGFHFYTASQTERDHIIATLGSVYRYEGVGYYVLTEAEPPPPPEPPGASTGTGTLAVTGRGLPLTRSYASRIPAGSAPVGGRALVIYLHGNGGTQAIPAALSQWTDQVGAVAMGLQGLAPNGVSNWEFRMDGRYPAASAGVAPAQGADDVQFISSAIDHAVSGGLGTAVNPSKVYLVGYSRGAGMAFVAYADPRTRNKIAAIAPVSGTFYCDMASPNNGVLGALPADADAQCGEVGFGWYSPKNSLFARATPARILGIWGKTANGELGYTQLESALDNPYNNVGFWAAWGGNTCERNVRSADGQLINAHATTIGYRQRSAAGASSACALDVTFLLDQTQGHVPAGYEEKIVKWLVGSYQPLP